MKTGAEGESLNDRTLCWDINEGEDNADRENEDKDRLDERRYGGMGGGPVKRLLVTADNDTANLSQSMLAPFMVVAAQCVSHAHKEDKKRQGLCEAVHAQPTAVKELTQYVTDPQMYTR